MTGAGERATFTRGFGDANVLVANVFVLGRTPGTGSGPDGDWAKVGEKEGDPVVVVVEHREWKKDNALD